MRKDLLGKTPERTLEAEIEDHLGYSKYDYKNKTWRCTPRCITPKQMSYARFVILQSSFPIKTETVYD